MENSLSKYIELLHNNPNLIENRNALIKIIVNEEKIRKWEIKNKDKLLSEGKPSEWAKIGFVYTDPYIVILRDLVEFPSGRVGSYFRLINQADLQGGQGIAVLANMKNKYLLLRQYRHPIRSWSFEIPRGFGEPGIAAEKQAENEIREEVGGEISKLFDLGIYFNNTGLEGNKVKLFFANLISVGKPAKEEGIESLYWVSLEELEKMIVNAQITDGFTIAAYTRAKLQGLF
ncbi:NUDIX hydrolase [Patescibacteria group bacterium]|nr:NUDIX hydrolase [Patescibacteria group bacterium]